jgi:hypothetical protein
MAISHNHGSSFGSNLKLSPPTGVDYNPYLSLPSVSAYGDHVAVGFVAGNYREIDSSIYKYILVKVSHDAGDTWSDELVAAYPEPNPPSIGPTSVAINNQSVCTVWQADSLYFDDDGTGVNVYSSCYRFADVETEEEEVEDDCASIISELESLRDDYEDLVSDYEGLLSDYEELLDDYDEVVEENDELAETNAELMSSMEEDQGGGIPGFPLISVTLSIIILSLYIKFNQK